MQPAIVRRTLFESTALRIGHVRVRPAAGQSEIQQQSSSVVVLPLAGVFAKHDGPRREVIGTPNHAVFLHAGQPYRLSFPGMIGDECLTLWLSGEAQDRCAPSAVHPHALLPASALVGRSLLWHRLRRGEGDPLELEEFAFALLRIVLGAARKTGRARRVVRPERRRRQVETVKEAIAVAPEHRWTLDALAQLAGASSYHLARVFHEEVGATIHRYLTRARLSAALGRVLDADDLAAIALDAGFTSHSHFTARFRRLFGVTPTELRRRASRAGA